MPKLFAFGCSYTYGYSLEDNYEDSVTKPSNLAWPKLVASELGIECINKGVTGASNTKILVETLDSTFEKDDIVIFLWSYMHRGLLIESPEISINMMPPVPHPLKKQYYQVHNQYDLLVRSVMDMHHANLFLSSKGIKTYNFYIDRTINNLNDSKLSNLLKDIGLIYLDLRKFRLDLAIDKMHPGPISQKEIANFILETVKKDDLNSLLYSDPVV